MIVGNYTPEDLKRLPLRAIVALAARYARRVEHLAVPSADHPEQERCRAAVTSAIRLAEDFAMGVSSPDIESVVREAEWCRSVVEADYVCSSATGAAVAAAHAAATAQRAVDLRSEPAERHILGPPEQNPFPHLADVTADLAARDAFVGALQAVGAERHDDAFLRAAAADYENLVRLHLGNYPEPGEPIDPSPAGPLGPLETLS
jgi:hypothetical protein